MRHTGIRELHLPRRASPPTFLDPPKLTGTPPVIGLL